MSRSTVQKAVQQRGWTEEKAFRATEQDAERIQELRRRFAERQQRVEAGWLLCLGEGGSTTAMMTIDGVTDAVVFEAYIELVLVPELRPGDVAVPDNLGAHRTRGGRDLVECAGARLWLIPPDSSEFNPIELAWSKLKAFLRTAKVCTREGLDNSVAMAMDLITPSDAVGWFRHCGYGYLSVTACEVRAEVLVRSGVTGWLADGFYGRWRADWTLGASIDQAETSSLRVERGATAMTFTRDLEHWREQARSGWREWADRVAEPAVPSALPPHFVDRYAYRCFRAAGRRPLEAMRLVPVEKARFRVANWQRRVASTWNTRRCAGSPPPPLTARVCDSPGPRRELLLQWRRHLAAHGITPPIHLFRVNPDETWTDLLARSVHAPLGRPAIPGPTFYERLSPNSRRIVDARFGPDAMWSLYAFLVQCHEETHILQQGEPLIGEIALAWMWCRFLDAEALWCWQEVEPGGDTFNIEAPWVRRLSIRPAEAGTLYLNSLAGVRRHFGGVELYDRLCEAGWEFDNGALRYREYLDRVVGLWNDWTPGGRDDYTGGAGVAASRTILCGDRSQL